MSKKFVTPRDPISSCKSIRMKNDLLAEIEAAIEGKDMTLTSFVVWACWQALKDLGLRGGALTADK